MARYRKQRNIGECGRDSQDDQNMIVDDEIRVTNGKVKGVTKLKRLKGKSMMRKGMPNLVTF
jgi:hypothetical protein